MKKPVFKHFNLQWHLTDKCPNQCRHCYLDQKKTPELSFQNIEKILNKFVLFLNENNFNGSISLTGGDPLLRKDFFKIARLINNYSIPFNILGTPETINEKNIADIKDINPEYIQFSLDGGQKVHDFIRGTNSYQRTIKKVLFLKENNIEVKLKFTLNNSNYGEIKKVFQICHKLGVSLSFDRCVPTNFENNQLTFSGKYKKILDKFVKLDRKYKNVDFNYKDPLWNLYYLPRLSFQEDEIYGCHIGFSGLALLPDGSVLICRKIPVIIGNALRDNFQELYYKNTIMKKLRDFTNYEKCRDCKALNICRGCRAMAYASSKNLFAPDPDCWIDLQKK